MAQDMAGVAAIVLAAGRSTRMGGPNKLLEDLDGFPLVRHVTQSAVASGARPVIVVTGYDAPAVETALRPLDVAFVANPAYADGLSTSLKAGIAALPETADAVVVLLGDMPLVSSTLIRRLVAAFEAEPAGIAAVPVYKGAWGNPAVIARAVFPQIANLSGDAGARRLLEGVKDRVIEVPVSDAAVETDVDTPEALARIRGQS